MGEVFFSVEFDTPLGPIKGRVCINEGSMALYELVPMAYELTNILVKRAKMKKERAGRQISCKAGCGSCCSQMVPLSPPEAFHLMNILDSVPHAQRSILFKELDRIAGQLKDKKMIEGLLDPEYHDEPVLKIAKQYFYLNMPCPFLREGSCFIYPNRPIACREYNVTSPPAWCSDPYSHEIEKVPMPIPFSAPLARLTAKLTGIKPRLIPLTLVPFWASQNHAIKEQKWPGLELFEAFMAELGSVKKD